MSGYRFLTAWLVDAPIERVWEVIHDVERWPAWWPGVEDVVAVAPGDEHGIGHVSRHVWWSRIPYGVQFEMRTTRVERPHLIEGVARGELAGIGRWRLYEGRGTAVTYEWDVRTTALWMNAIAPVARPLFAWNHTAVMRRGGYGLARRLGVELLAQS